MRIAAALLALCGLAALAGAAFPPVPKAKENNVTAGELPKELQGNWEVTLLERTGPTGKVASKPPYKFTLTFDGKNLDRKLVLQGKELKGVSSTYTLDTTKSPPWIDVKTETSTAGQVSVTKGIVKVDGDTMTWYYASGTGYRPKRFDADLGNLQYRYTLRRLKK
jgi:uncharacterized protein (TIGR03067 family)